MNRVVWTQPERDDRFVAGDAYARPSGYSDGVTVSGRHVVLAGQVGWNPLTAEFETDQLTGQVRQALMNIVALLEEAAVVPE